VITCEIQHQIISKLFQCFTLHVTTSEINILAAEIISQLFEINNN